MWNTDAARRKHGQDTDAGTWGIGNNKPFYGGVMRSYMSGVF